ncbi:MAG: small multi-drug export protein [Patescibacteria group bacterium]
MFDLNYIEIFKNISPQFATFLIAMIPVAELRVALPLAITAYKLSLWEALFFSILGNIVPVFFILYFVEPFTEFLMKHSRIFKSFFTWLFKRTRIKFAGNYEKYGLLALAIFVAIPLPMTGAWTGALAAFLFQIPKKQAAIYILLGIFCAAIIVTFLTFSTLGTINLFK